MRVSLIDSLRDVQAAAWDALTGANDPFAEHAFLLALEESGAVGHAAGWITRHVTVWDRDRLCGAMPLYEKSHSYGEFIFDWAWADASHRLREPYYPKLVSMIPLTPATGRRLLMADDITAKKRAAITAKLVEGAFEAADKVDASSIHMLFVTQEEERALIADKRLRPRASSQFHWHNDGYKTFDDYLAKFRASSRKQVRRERQGVAASGLTVRVKEGPELDDKDWEALQQFYVDTCEKRGSPAYLPPEFFERIRATFGHRTVAVMAYRGGEPVAGTLNFEKGAHLYGRYWGCFEEVEFLHFELCYYRLIERAIAKGMTRFEAGAQGEHKLKRGLMPSLTRSVHWLRKEALARAVDDYLPREAFAVMREMEEMAAHGPFRRGEGDDGAPSGKGPTP